MNNIEIVEYEVRKIISFDKSGHGIEHINRVVELSKKIALNEDCNIDFVTIIALLHEVDDYKLFGEESSNNLINAKKILNKINISLDDKEYIIESIRTIGYSKRLAGIEAATIEAKIVSDADMLDAMGASGLIRTIQYNFVKNNSFFDSEKYPNMDIDFNTYSKNKNGTAVNHLFEKILKLKNMMYTNYGKKEARIRNDFVIEFLREYFYEIENDDWNNFLNEYLEKYN